MRVSTQKMSVIAMNKSNDKGGEAASECSVVRGCPLAGMFYHRGRWLIPACGSWMPIYGIVCPVSGYIVPVCGMCFERLMPVSG